MSVFGRMRRHFDWPLFVSLLALMLVGVANLYSATFTTRMTLLRQQVVWYALGLAAFVVTTAIDYRVLYRLAYPLYGVGVLSLVAVLLTGKTVNHSRRWLDIAGLAVQPSEVVKVLLVIALAKYLHDDTVSGERTLKHMAVPFLLAGIPAVLVLRQPDLGTAVIIFLVFISVMTLLKLSLRAIVTLFAVTVAALPISWVYLLKPYQKQRIFTFFDASSDPTGAGWQARQSLFAVGSGGLTGKGYLQGTQNRFHFLPERWTDFPLAVWAEEWGFIGSAALLAVYLFIVLWCVKVASQARDRFGAVLCVGVAAIYFWHTVVSVSMVTGMVPVVGVTLPLVSYGGSSVLTMLVAAGLVMNVSVRKSAY